MSDVTKKISVVVETLIGDGANKLNGFVKATKDTESNLKDVASASSAASVAMGVFTGSLALDVAKSFGEAIAGVVIQMKDLGLQTQQTIAKIGAMKNYLGDATQAYQYFNDVGRGTNYSLEAVQEMGAQLLNMGYSAKNAADLIQLCADTAAGLNQGQAGAQQLVDTLSRIQATGEMSSRQLISLQMAGMDLDKAFSAVGMSAEQAMKAMDDGTLDAQTAIKALTDYMHEFDGSMEKSKNNLTDMWGDVSGNVSTAMGEIGASIADAFSQSGIVQELISFTQDLVDLVRNDGSGAFQDLKTVASEVLDFIGGLLTFVLDTFKLIIVIINDTYAAFKSFGSQVVDAIRPAVDAVITLYNAVKSVLSAVGAGFHGEVAKSFGVTFDSGIEPEERAEQRRKETQNNFRKLNRGGSARSGGGGGGGGGAKTLSEEEKAIEALIKKYSDADKMLKNVIKSEIEVAKVNLTMMPESARAVEEVQVKLMSLKAAHDEVLNGYDFIARFNYTAQVWWYLVRRELLIKKNLLLPVGHVLEEAAFNMRLFLKAERLAQVPNVAYCYRNRPSSIMHNADEEHVSKMLDDYIFAASSMNEAIEEYRDKLHGECYERCRTRRDSYVLFGAVRAFKLGKVKEYLQKAKEQELYPINRLSEVDYPGFKFKLLHWFVSKPWLWNALSKIYNSEIRNR